MKRRGLLVGGAVAAGALVVGWLFVPPRSRLGRGGLLATDAGGVGLNGWIRIEPDGSVALAMPRSEMGQGVHTALAMLVADELDVPLARVRLIEAGHESLYGNVAMFVESLPLHPEDKEPGHETRGVRASQWIVSKVARELGINATGGSSSIADAWEPLRLAAATARAQLLGAASLRWKLPLAELKVDAGTISHPSGPQGHFGEFARAAAATPPGDVRLKRPEQWRLIGRPVPRIDTPAKSDGSAVFGIDVRLPGMLHAVVRMSPTLGGSPGRVDAEAALARPGVVRVVRIPAAGSAPPAIGVIARSRWQAEQGARALAIDWPAPPAVAPSSRAILDELERLARTRDGLAFHTRGDAAAALAQAPAQRRVEALYRAPYLAHATMEPMNGTARVDGGRVEVWVPTQVPGFARRLAAQVAGVDEAAVTVHVTYLGGGFGRRLDADVVAHAVRLAMETAGAPVQLIWSREDDLRHDFYRPAAAAWMRAALDADGAPVALAITSAGDAITPRWLERNLPLLAGPVDLPDKTAIEGLFGLPYDVPHQRIAHHATRSRVPVGFWRSVGHSHNAFFGESFIDELAHAARADPLAWRLARLGTLPRHAAVLRLAAEKAGWASPAPAGRARGVALHESFGSIVAQVVEASVEAGRPRLHRVVCAADVGRVVNPGIVERQMESAIVFGLGAALTGRIDIEAGQVRQSSFHDYPVPRMPEIPRIETHLIASERPPGGVGEPGTPPLAPALANALFVLTGKRLRELPLQL
jgi:isoquinoline 1-oxidoreductase beta subunit